MIGMLLILPAVDQWTVVSRHQVFFKLEIILTGETLPRVTNCELNEQKQAKLMTMNGLFD